MKRVLHNLIWTTSSKLADAAVRFLTVPIVLGHFGKAQFGLLALAFSINVFLSIADFGLNINAIRRLADYQARQDWPAVAKLVRSCSFYYSLIGFVNLAGVLVVGWMAPQWFNLDAVQAETFMWMMVSLGVASWLGWSFAIHRQIIQAAGQLGWDERNMLFCTVGAAALVGLTVWLDLTLVSYFIGSMLVGCIPIVLRLNKVRQLVPGLTIGFKADWQIFKPMVNTSLLIFMMSLSHLMANNFRPIILAAEGTLNDVADYRIIQGVVSFALMVSGGALNVIYPEVARLEAEGETGRLRELTYRGTSLLLWSHMLLLVPLALCSELILRLYVGPGFVHLALPLALWLLTCLAGHNAVFSSVLLSRGMIGMLTLTSVVNAAATLALAYVLVPAFGLNAVIGTYVLFVVLQTLVFYLLLVPKLGFGRWHDVLRIMVTPLLGSLVAAAVSVGIASALHAPLWIAGVISAIVIIGLGWSIGDVAKNLRFFARGRGG